MPTIEIEKIRINYSAKPGTSRSRTYFRFKPDMTLEICFPRGRRVDIDSEIKSNRGWILRKYRELSRWKRVLDDERVMFDGVYLRIVFEENDENEEIQPDLERREILVRTSDRKRIRELVRRWFLKETSRYVIKKLSTISGEFPVKWRRADVREISNWGYCTKDGRLSFSWQLIALPEKLREYVVLHELAHLLEFSHSPAFRRQLARLCPDYREREKDLRLILPYASLKRNSLTKKVIPSGLA